MSPPANPTLEMLLRALRNYHGVVQSGNIDIQHRPIVRNADGSYSTVRSITVTLDNGHAVLIPTVIGNRVVSNNAAIAHWRKTGQHLGVFTNEAVANRYAGMLHREQMAAFPEVGIGATAGGVFG